MPRRSTSNGDATPEPVVVDVLADPAPPPASPPPVNPLPPVLQRPAPDASLSPDQLRIRQLEDQLAQERGAKDPEVQVEHAGDGEKILIHFVEDGFTALGMVWYRGQELEVVIGGGPWNDTCDRLGHSWLDLRDDESAQIDRWGKVMFRPGAWRGKPLEAATTARWDNLKPLRDGQTLTPSDEELRKAAEQEARRGRAAPRLPTR